MGRSLARCPTGMEHFALQGREESHEPDGRLRRAVAPASGGTVAGDAACRGRLPGIGRRRERVRLHEHGFPWPFGLRHRLGGRRPEPPRQPHGFHVPGGRNLDRGGRQRRHPGWTAAGDAGFRRRFVSPGGVSPGRRLQRHERKRLVRRGRGIRRRRIADRRRRRHLSDLVDDRRRLPDLRLAGRIHCDGLRGKPAGADGRPRRGRRRRQRQG